MADTSTVNPSIKRTRRISKDGLNVWKDVVLMVDVVKHEDASGTVDLWIEKVVDL